MSLVLLNLDRDTFLPLHRAAEKGDEDAARQIEAMWADTPTARLNVSFAVRHC